MNRPFAHRQSGDSVDKCIEMVRRRQEADLSGEAPVVLTGDKLAIILANEILHMRKEH